MAYFIMAVSYNYGFDCCDGVSLAKPSYTRKWCAAVTGKNEKKQKVNSEHQKLHCDCPVEELSPCWTSRTGDGVFHSRTVLKCDGPSLYCYCFLKKCGLWLLLISLLEKHLTILQSGVSWRLKRCLLEPVLFAQQDGYLTNKFLPKGSWGRRKVGFWYDIFISECFSLNISGTWYYTLYDLSVKIVRKHFLMQSIIANNSSQLSCIWLPFNNSCMTQKRFKLYFVIN